MTDEPEQSQKGGGAEIDPGEPIWALAHFEADTAADLLIRVRRKIQRRTTVGHLTAFAASAPLVVLKEFWELLNDQLSPMKTRKDIGHGETTY
jgi:hypothetical protein